MSLLLFLAFSFIIRCFSTRFISKQDEIAYYARSSFSLNAANISAYLSAGAYCGVDRYMSMELKGPASGFVVTDMIYDEKTDTQGYVGILPSDSSIYIVFRGSTSITNWIINMDVIKTPYTSFPECADCNVHKGWYLSEQAVITDVINKVSSLNAKYPNYAIKLTGHSLGAALAQFVSMDLVRAGLPKDKISVLNFGQPRTGDGNYATFVPSVVASGVTWRVVHDRDIVPHLPPEPGMTYVHICRELFEDSSGNYNECSANNCEDPNCCAQYDVTETNGDAHCYYLGGYPICDCLSAVV
jgi:hypothetical protein